MENQLWHKKSQDSETRHKMTWTVFIGITPTVPPSVRESPLIKEGSMLCRNNSCKDKKWLRECKRIIFLFELRIFPKKKRNSFFLKFERIRCRLEKKTNAWLPVPFQLMEQFLMVKPLTSVFGDANKNWNHKSVVNICQADAPPARKGTKCSRFQCDYLIPLTLFFGENPLLVSIAALQKPFLLVFIDIYLLNTMNPNFGLICIG